MKLVYGTFRKHSKQGQILNVKHPQLQSTGRTAQPPQCSLEYGSFGGSITLTKAKLGQANITARHPLKTDKQHCLIGINENVQE